VSFEKFINKACNQKPNELLVVIPEPLIEGADKYSKIEEFENKLDENKYFILFLSIFDKENKEFAEFYKDYVFIVEHYTNFLKIPFEVKKLKEILEEEEKEYLSLREVANYYSELKKFFTKTGYK